MNQSNSELIEEYCIIESMSVTQIEMALNAMSASERERQIAIAFAENVKFGYIKVVGGWLSCLDKKPIETIEEVFDRFTESDLFKSIPPAMPLPTEIEVDKHAKEMAIDLCKNDTNSEGVNIGEYTMDAFITGYRLCWSWINERK